MITQTAYGLLGAAPMTEEIVVKQRELSPVIPPEVLLPLENTPPTDDIADTYDKYDIGSLPCTD